MTRLLFPTLVLFLGAVSPFATGAAQDRTVPAALAAERAEYARWLLTAPNSPFAALVLQPIGPGLSLGPAGADVPLPGFPPANLVESGGVPILTRSGRKTPLARHRALPVDGYRLLIGGPAGRSVLAVFGTVHDTKPPIYYPYNAAQVYTVTLTPPEKPRVQRLLGPDGLEVESTEAGSVALSIGGVRSTLRVMRLPVAGTEESDLEIYFRDATNGQGTYPAGRFVQLTPLGGTRYRLDLNRARNSFCAYSTVYPCPAPWRGNTLDAAVTAGERYLGGGLDVSLPSSDR